MRTRQANEERWGGTRVPLTLAVAVAWLATLTGTSAAARDFCKDTARAQFIACQAELKDDRWTQKAICLNTAADDERDECFDEFRAARKEGMEECRDQRDARRDLCDLLGPGRYDPPFDPNDFDTDFTSLTTPNPHFPLAIGDHWVYESEDETTTINVLAKTKLIDGVTCIVVNDLVEEDGETREDTDDWFAHHVDGGVHYCGESVRDFESFDGDVPKEPELVETEGSFKAGRDGDKSGVLFPGTPVVGHTFRQEFSAGNAEDAATIVSTTYGFGTGDPALDAFVPEDLANHLCNGDCVVVAEFTPIEPGVFERKYYAPGVGRFLEVKPDTPDGEISRLVECAVATDVSNKCATLPLP